MKNEPIPDSSTCTGQKPYATSLRWLLGVIAWDKTGQLIARMRRRFLTSMSVLLLLTSGFNAAGSAPSGHPPKDAQEAFSKADAVFMGRVEKVLKDAYGYDSTAKVEVQKVWKGSKILSSVVSVDGTGGPTYPARTFKEGAVYLFYLPVLADGKRLRADSFLHRVLPKDEASGDIEYLSKQQKQ